MNPRERDRATAEPELPGITEYADRLETAHRAATWPGIPQADPAPGPPVQLELPRAVDAPPLEA
ncbi:hypothetical protein ACFV4E_22780 [Streptomyces hygroscopicus]|uniref:Uncharacterized protein n=1 Tax=Streptomyces hygroscopicus TaxID=1912 RepID=A0ABQ3UFB8_STRHY|nr:hypothetical protein [Streptomyces hygroscopicus]GHJ34294.1 hypothetical protein TPA0910_87270 [Streptomyces hygroscopicus]